MHQNRTKTSFILELLKEDHFDSGEKDRLFGLVTEEIQGMENSNDAIRSEVNNIKNQLEVILNNKSPFNVGTNITDSSSEAHIVIHKPQKLVNILARFSKGGNKIESVLKHSVHDWIVGVDYKSYEEFMKILNKEFGKISEDLKSLSYNLYAKCSTFLLNEEVSINGWGHKNEDSRFRMGWGSPELGKWCKENPSKNPQDFSTPREYREPIKGLRLYKFRDFINQFKYQIEVRDERGATFRDLVETVLKEVGLSGLSEEKNEIDDAHLDSKVFYTDVQWLKIVLQNIFKQIRDKIKNGKGTNTVHLEVIENEVIEFRITHVDSFNTGLSVETNNKLTQLSGDFEYIRGKIKNLCDWSVETEFKEGAYRLNYLVSDENISFKQEIDNCDGFTHILKFYKPSI